MKSHPHLHLAIIAIFTSAQSSASFLGDVISSASPLNISWGPCVQEFERDKSYNTTVECGNLTVPLDYNDRSKGIIELNLLRAHAPKGPARGSVLMNFGGPGEAGRSNLVKSLPWAFTQVAALHFSIHEMLTQKLSMTGFVYDLVIFDPR